MSERIFVLSLWAMLLVISSAFAIEKVYPAPSSVVSTDVTLKWHGNGTIYYVYLGPTPQYLGIKG